MFLFQIFENIAMTMGLMPVTGITLPFLSGGGTSVIASMIAVGMQRAHVCYADGSFTGQMQRFLSPAVLNRTHDFDNHCDALNTIVEKCFGRVVTSLGISNDVERARRRLATEISLGSISAAVLPKRTLGLS